MIARNAEGGRKMLSGIIAEPEFRLVKTEVKLEETGNPFMR